MATTLKNVKHGRRRYRLVHPEKFVLAAILMISVTVFLAVLVFGGRDSEAENDDPVHTIEGESQAESEVYVKGSVSLGAISQQIQGMLSGMMSANADNYGKDPDLQDSEGWMDPDDEEEYVYCLVLDAGHGAEDPGNMKGQSYEKYINLAVALQVQKYIEETAPEVKVVMTRDEEEWVSPEERVQISLDANADFVLSLHCNAYNGSGRASGTETLYWSAGDGDERAEKSLLAAQKLLEVTADTMGIPRRSPHINQNTLIRLSTAPAVLIEMGFLSDETDDALLNDPVMQEKLGEAIGQAVIDILRTYEPVRGQQPSDESDPESSVVEESTVTE